MSAFYVVAYASLSLPAVLAGLLVTQLGLRTTFEVFGAAVAGSRSSSPSRPGARDRGSEARPQAPRDSAARRSQNRNQSAPYGT